ncbi:MAG: cytochrome c [Paracoccaceae bacterium]
MQTRLGRLIRIAGVLGPALVLVAIGALVFTSRENRTHRIDTSIGAELYAANCASCHGVNLEVEPDWQTPKSDGILPAPPHDENGHTWHHSDRQLLAYIKLGGTEALAQDGVAGFKSGMPDFAGVLNDAEIAAVMDFIKSSWPEEIRDIQQLRTETEEEIY